MHTVGDILGGMAAPLTIECEGKVYRAHAIDQRRKSAFEAWLAQRVLGPFLAAQEAGGPSFAAAVGVVADRIAEGKYSFHGPLAADVMKTPDGVLTLTRIIFDCTEAEALVLIASKPKEAGALVGLVFRRSFPQAASAEPTPGAEGEDPNPPGPGPSQATRSQP